MATLLHWLATFVSTRKDSQKKQWEIAALRVSDWRPFPHYYCSLCSITSISFTVLLLLLSLPYLLGTIRLAHSIISICWHSVRNGWHSDGSQFSLARSSLTSTHLGCTYRASVITVVHCTTTSPGATIRAYQRNEWQRKGYHHHYNQHDHSLISNGNLHPIAILALLPFTFLPAERSFLNCCLILLAHLWPIYRHYGSLWCVWLPKECRRGEKGCCENC